MIQAVEALQHALVIMQQIGNRAAEGATLNNIGGLYTAQAQHANALESYQQALSIAQEVGNRTGEGDTLSNIGGVYVDLGRPADALDYYQQSLSIRREVGNRAGEGETLYYLGQAYRQQGDTQRALIYYELAMTIFESLRAIAGSETGRASFIAQHAGLYDRAVELYHQRSQDAKALHTSERGRARAFLDSIATGRVELSDYEAVNLVTREQEAYAARQASQEALARARAANPPDPVLVADLGVLLTAAEEEHVAALAAIQARHDQLAALVPGRTAILELKEMQTLLDERTTLVVYHVLREQGTLAFIITGDSLAVVELPEATPENLRTAVEDLYQWLNLDNPHPLPLQNLYAWLVEPLANHLHTPQVGIVPHQLLHYVPFAALTDGENYFGQEHTLFTLPSASTLPFIQENAVRAAANGRESAVVVGNPTTGDYDPVASLSMERDALGNLPFAEEEARAIADLYSVEPLLGQDAMEGTVRAQASQADILHLAAHGKFNPVAPLSSLIALAPDDEYDGWLTVGEVYGLDLSQTDLVVLSACETQLGDLSAGDELIGLTRAFFFAGTPTVLASLWSVDDAATEELMVSFYRNWQQGMGKAEALQAAQAEVRESHPSPFYWAAFVLNGDPGPVSAPKPTTVPSLTPTTVATAEPTIVPSLTPTTKANASPTPVKPATESDGGGLCGGLGTILPLVFLGLRGARRRGMLQ